MISVAEARARILSAFAPLPAETVALSEALGRVLAEPVVARLTQPPFHAAAMDGWAVRSADITAATAESPIPLRRIGESAAGRAFTGSVGPGEAVRIFTGAPLPHGADAVVMQEDCSADDHTVRIGRAVVAGRFIREAGFDFTLGQELLPKGRRLTARDIALSAGGNVPWLSVHRRPRIAVLATGDEIALPGDPLGPSQIVSTNALGLCALVTAQGGIAHNLGVAKDTPESVAALAKGAAGCDLLVTTGGAAHGDYDLVRDVLAERGVALEVQAVAMRPGKAVMFGHAGAVPLLGLPGNPVSTGVTAILFLRPILRLLQGLPPVDARTPLRARLTAPLRANDRREDYLRATLATGPDGVLTVTPFARQDSAITTLYAQADCLIPRPPNADPEPAGALVTVLPLTDGMLSI
ncbi:gephyrin-like molybdotransferase Glp [Azospirillum sp. B506]|uniref:molybdopterin molybdotransferase MoeA n=1 Tax=Azospirillum sp. B506 TaxID=137721 RepID=UPI000346A5AF|nr:gephyrin-like molybdotransferase Glp [Azospirillum sp. B506]